MSFLIALGIALVLTPAAGWIGRATGLVNRPDGDRLNIHVEPIAVLGGVAVVASVLATLAVTGNWLPASIGVAVAIALGAGLLDDAKGLPVWALILSIAATGVVLAVGGVRLEPLGQFGAAATVLLVFACANGVNLLDGQDGLAGGLAGIAGLGLVMLVAVNGGVAPALGLALAGSLAGFLVWNCSPRPIFLGNGGAYAVGTLLAALAATAVDGLGVPGLLAAGLCLGMFAFELCFTVARRLLSGRSLVVGDRLHSYDLLAVEAGGRRQATAICWALGAGALALALLVSVLSPVAGAGATVAAAAAAAMGGARLWSRSAAWRGAVIERKGLAPYARA